MLFTFTKELDLIYEFLFVAHDAADTMLEPCDAYVYVCLSVAQLTAQCYAVECIKHVRMDS